MRYTDLKNPTQSGVLCVPGIYPQQSGWNIPPCEGGLLDEFILDAAESIPVQKMFQDIYGGAKRQRLPVV